jgi:signal transduction histidine kinase
MRLEDFGRSLLELMEPVARERGLSLRFVAELEDTELVGDVDQLRQVMLNLVSNALDASPIGGEVLLHFSEADPPAEILAQRPVQRVAVLEVVDEGEGVATDQIERLFVPFFTTKSEGTGLGLAIAEKLIRAHQGNLRYLRREGRTVLRAVIPLVATGAEQTPDPGRLQARG